MLLEVLLVSKKRLILAVVIIVIGITGFIPSTFFALPYLSNTIQDAVQASQEARQEQTITTLESNVTTIRIVSDIYSVSLRQSATDKIQLKKVDGTSQQVDVTYEVKDDVLTINVKSNYHEPQSEKITTFKQFVESGVQRLATTILTPSVVIEVPQKVNVDVTTQDGDVYIESAAMIKDNLTYQTRNGHLAFGNVTGNEGLKELKIQATSYLVLNATTLLPFEKATIEGYRVNLYSSDTGIGKNLANTKEVNLRASEGSIEFDTPFFKTLNVEAGEEGSLHLDIPLAKWNPKVKVEANSPSVVLEGTALAKEVQTFHDYAYPNSPEGNMEINVISHGAHVVIGD